MPRPETSREDGLSHVVVCGGSSADWNAMGSAEWTTRFATIARGVGDAGARWVTVFPHHSSTGESSDIGEALAGVDKVEHITPSGMDRYVWRRDDGLSIVVDPSTDGHDRFARVVDHLRVSLPDFNEDALSDALAFPVETQADLVLILGPPDVLPTSLVWELAYSELVFLDISWEQLQSVHLEMAIDDFNRRHRRFGGLDS